ncbi:integrase catalytic domain-containing protein [Trichonephila clavipes]|uniref:Integrase catalytic domain-containing protein n=1 Tax=Trichonephila clavipes TaxID=2585209 RepID=A0A8X6W3M1_TRICX|nr:integrase catalytic domain-containing protein [Trichonephila clavipes]
MIHSRPITYVGRETEEPIPLTPAHFIIKKRITLLPLVRFRLDSNLSSRKCLLKAFNYHEKLIRRFWSRWRNVDEAHFWLNGYVNKQNCRIWSEANAQVYVETPLHPEKLTVWCALWAGGILLQKR